jgi:ubiquinone/menaquinone biosynthesis C-methylase UbiE
MKNYYQQIETYYDKDAGDFDHRYWQNPVLQRIRQDFREQVKRYTFTNMLEIGYGTGIDLVHFAKTHPHVQVAGIDISGEMQKIAEAKGKAAHLKNLRVEKGKVEDIPELFHEKQFDMIYVFFGALNTVDDLGKTAQMLFQCTSLGGVLVLSFVNKYYMAGMLIELAKLRFRAAFSRMNRVWGGYSPSQFLPSKCYSPYEIKRAFNDFKLLKSKGYSIIHPAWYYHGLNRLLRRALPVLWKADQLLNKTPFRGFGEYMLYVFQKERL